MPVPVLHRASCLLDYREVRLLGWLGCLQVLQTEQGMPSLLHLASFADIRQRSTKLLHVQLQLGAINCAKQVSSGPSWNDVT